MFTKLEKLCIGIVACVLRNGVYRAAWKSIVSNGFINSGPYRNETDKSLFVRNIVAVSMLLCVA